MNFLSRLAARTQNRATGGGVIMISPKRIDMAAAIIKCGDVKALQADSSMNS